MALRRSQLEDSVQLHQFTHDSNEEMRWVREREPAANSTLLGDSLTSVQGLIKKHQVRGRVLGRGIGVLYLIKVALNQVTPSYRHNLMHCESSQCVLARPCIACKIFSIHHHSCTITVTLMHAVPWDRAHKSRGCTDGCGQQGARAGYCRSHRLRDHRQEGGGASGDVVQSLRGSCQEDSAA